jgi:hypothetical protein
MPTALTEMKKADRERMAAMVVELCEARGATVERQAPDLGHPREVVLSVQLGEGRVTVDFDGTKGAAEDRDVYCMPWNTVHGSDARMTDAFGKAVGAEVNPHHRAKCMGFACGIDELLLRLGAALDCIRQGRAFEDRLATAA